MVRRFEEQERLASESKDEEDYGSDIDGLYDAYDSDEDDSFAREDMDRDDHPVWTGM
jgi:hypothetical protein